MLESEAKKTRCIGGENLGEWRDPHGRSPAEVLGRNMRRFCIGSACLAWRWHKTKLRTTIPHPFGTAESYSDLPAEKREGHCGLAGPVKTTYAYEDKP